MHILTVKPIFIGGLRKLHAGLPHQFIMLVEQQKFFIGFTNVKYGNYFAGTHKQSFFIYRPVATVLSPRSRIRFSRILPARNARTGSSAPPESSLACATSGRRSVRKAS